MLIFISSDKHPHSHQTNLNHPLNPSQPLPLVPIPSNSQITPIQYPNQNFHFTNYPVPELSSLHLQTAYQHSNEQKLLLINRVNDTTFSLTPISTITPIIQHSMVPISDDNIKLKSSLDTQSSQNYTLNTSPSFSTNHQSTFQHEPISLPPLPPLNCMSNSPLSSATINTVPNLDITDVPIIKHEIEEKCQPKMEIDCKSAAQRKHRNDDISIKRENNTLRYRCHIETCNKSYKNERDLKRHFRIHDPSTPGCPYCGKKFSRNGHLEDHIRTHTGEKPYDCKICKKRFACLRNLSQHKSVHKARY